MPKNKKPKLEKDDKDDDNKVVDDDDDDLSSESSSDDDSLVLEGVLVRNPDVSDSDDSSDDGDDGNEDKDKHDDVNDEDTNEPDSKVDAKRDQNKRAAPNKSSNQKKKQKNPKNAKRDEPEIDIVHVDFIFCDMAEHYWDGIKALLSNGATLYQAHSSALADAMIEYDMVGTVIGQPDDPEHIVYGFSSFLHWAHFPKPAQTAFEKVCQQEIVATKHKDKVKNGQATQKRLLQALATCREKGNANVAVLMTGRMINVPIEIVSALHQQLWLDLQWAQKEKTKLSYKKIQTILRLAPCTRDNEASGDGESYTYRYFEDELWAAQAKGIYVVTAPKSFSKEDTVYLHVLEMDINGYHRGLQALEKLANSGGNKWIQKESRLFSYKRYRDCQ